MTSYQFVVTPPKYNQVMVNKPLLCGPGPSDIWPSVQESLSLPVVTSLCDDSAKIVEDIRAGLQYVFQTRSKLVLAISGSGHSGMEAIINNLVAPGEKLLIAARGIWDERALTMAQRYGINTVVIRRPSTETFTMEELELALKQQRPTALFITHGDSSTGTIQDLKNLGHICHKHGALLLVDTVVSLGGVPFFMDEWGVDAVYTGTQKALSGPAGIAPVAFSARAEEKIRSRKHEPVFYFDVKLIANHWNCYGDTRTYKFYTPVLIYALQMHLVFNTKASFIMGPIGWLSRYHHTLSPPLLHSLRACLQEISRETLQVGWARHARATRRFHEGLRKLPVEYFVPEPANRLDTVTTLVLPKGYDNVAFRNYILKKHNILIFGGLGPTAGKVLRIGIMGVNANEKVADALIRALADALEKLKKSNL